MIAWELLARAKVPGSPAELTLHRRGAELSIRSGGIELMNSRAHASEDALAELSCRPIAERSCARVLIGGLGMGYTLRAALDCLSADAQLTVAELLPAVVEWNRNYFFHLANDPLSDARVTVQTGDVAELLRARAMAYDAIVLDVDNGPVGLNRASNNWLYGHTGLATAARALRRGGILSVWSASSEDAFGERLRVHGFDVQVRRVRGHAGNKGAHHTLWIGTAPRS